MDWPRAVTIRQLTASAMVPPQEMSSIFEFATGYCTICYNEEYYQNERLEENDVGFACGNHRKDDCINVSVGKPEGKRLLSWSRSRWQIIIKMIFMKQNRSLWT